ncbi:alpha/beta hydrolase [Roseovarius sp. SCSIO 43702]|uniref:alpha/beta hydrolase n=1 Tax=Roseovarius sp. SCSIO 43702 TaxID=2823043 RepID=UPI001C72E296|nr:alpha/beta hydrolase [Roseovarius sp. SCSIO 43702]QYX58230.1 alpha/beta hydrolase [Roseovarius sp. SCSIO 43702]
MRDAPLHHDIADGPDGGRAWWLEAEDGVRIRLGAWSHAGARGTIVLFPGRTEYIEKYGRAARDLALRGYGLVAVDWRGQGLADRLADDVLSGHVHYFDDYQRDVRAVFAALGRLDLPRPWVLLGHSMGGCIGLRALHNGVPVAGSLFSAPMWGIRMAELLRPVAWSLGWGSRRVGMDHLYAPGTQANPYVLSEPFATNKLTRDEEMYRYMIDQTNACPALGLGGPSLRWLHEALIECRRLARMPSPDLPCLTFLGTDEDIVDPGSIHARMNAWPGGTLKMLDGARHEVMMETPETRQLVFDRMAEFMAALPDRPEPAQSSMATSCR